MAYHAKHSYTFFILSPSVCPSITSQILFSQWWSAPHHLRGHGSRQYRQLWQWGASAVVSPIFDSALKVELHQLMLCTILYTSHFLEI